MFLRKRRMMAAICLGGAMLASAVLASGCAVVQQWAVVKAGLEPGAVTVDAAGNSYVTGTDGAAMVTVKYDTAGNELWTARYRAANSEAAGYGVTVDRAGNVYVTGSAFVFDQERPDAHAVVVKYSPAGAQLWAGTTERSGETLEFAGYIGVDNGGNVIVAGAQLAVDEQAIEELDYDYMVAKFSPGGRLAWQETYDSNEGADIVLSLAVTASGEAYVTGYTLTGITDPAAEVDDFGVGIATVKFAPSGARAWVRTEAGAGTLLTGTDIALDAAGNAYVAGESPEALITRKYTAGGAQQWSQRLPVGSSGAGAARVAVDAAGNAIIAGEANGEIVLVKYAPGGSQLWTARHAVAGGAAPASVTELVVDASGAAYVTATSGAFGDSPGDAFETVKFDAGGALKWSTRYEAPDSFAIGLALDAAGNVYVGGLVEFGDAAAVVKYTQMP